MRSDTGKRFNRDAKGGGYEETLLRSSEDRPQPLSDAVEMVRIERITVRKCAPDDPEWREFFLLAHDGRMIPEDDRLPEFIRDQLRTGGCLLYDDSASKGKRVARSEDLAGFVPVAECPLFSNPGHPVGNLDHDGEPDRKE